MRSTDERLRAVEQRMAALDRERRGRRIGRIAIASAAACLALIAALSLLMPRWAELPGGAQGGVPGAAASLFSSNGAAGCLVIGILGFLLGVSVTILCFRLRDRERDREDEGAEP